MNLIQRQLLPELVSLNLLADPPRLAVPVHYVFGELDPLTPAAMVKELPAAITTQSTRQFWCPAQGIWCILTSRRWCVLLR